MELHPQLQQDTYFLGRFSLSSLLLMKNADYPWFILVPERDRITEIFQLNDADQSQLIKESSLLSVCLLDAYQADKINIAAIGNLVPQLHLHHVVRFKTDALWPAPIWGKAGVTSCSDDYRERAIELIKPHISDEFNFT